ncbi:protein of unknown function [Flexibacter flexilis DSM 6793]|uniref:SiaC family regulatory phosphoprotein domain-containing protein n=1 Tax=Flexibacter flexilis DSM 6793 TaxID=927664 RepID=A0A1I1LHA1_9BACT|nr:DUF1987 domain-containing protein [Flexibacter flexilis]SFC70368.1 protein of unknown function [Flexibacter flexilis DSM 6793]
MEAIILEKETYLPAVVLDAQNERFEFMGKSIPENASEFFAPILVWIDNYIVIPNEETNVKFHLEYFNTSTSKYLLEIMRKLEKLYQNTDKAVMISWFVEDGDTDVEEAGLDYKAILKVPFEVITVDADGSIVNVIESTTPPRNGVTANTARPSESIPQNIRDLAKELLNMGDDLPPLVPATVHHAETVANDTAAADLDVVTSISDRLQKKLNQANETLQQQAEEIRQINQDLNFKNKELQETVDALTKARAGRRAATIVLFIAVGLFIVSEAIEWVIENMTQNVLAVYWVILIKLLIALLLKPIESVLETNILQHNAKASVQED